MRTDSARFGVGLLAQKNYTPVDISIMRMTRSQNSKFAWTRYQTLKIAFQRGFVEDESGLYPHYMSGMNTENLGNVLLNV